MHRRWRSAVSSLWHLILPSLVKAAARPDAVHTDLYDGGEKDAIPFDKLEQFFRKI